MSVTQRTRWLKVGAPVLIAALAIAACSSSGTKSSTSGAAGSSPAGGSSSTSAATDAVLSLAQLYAGTYVTPPSTSPPGAKGKSVWWISCSQAVVSCSGAAAAGAEAAKALGIDFHVADGKFNVGGAFNTAIQTALAAKPDAILLYGVACELTKGALENAKTQGVLVMGVDTPDCSDSGGPQLFNVHEIESTKYPTIPDFWRAYGALQADYVIDKSNGSAKIITQAGTEPLQKFVAEGFSAEIKKCSGCSIVNTVTYDSSTLTPNGPWIQAFRAALVQHPEATAVNLPWEVMMTATGGASAVKQTGRNLMIFGGQASPDGIQALQQGQISAITTAESRGWSGYAAMDEINRALQKAPLVPEGLGFQLMDSSHNMPASGTDYQPPIDYKAAFLKAWNDGKGTA